MLFEKRVSELEFLVDSVNVKRYADDSVLVFQQALTLKLTLKLTWCWRLTTWSSLWNSPSALKDLRCLWDQTPHSESSSPPPTSSFVTAAIAEPPPAVNPTLGVITPLVKKKRKKKKEPHAHTPACRLVFCGNAEQHFSCLVLTVINDNHSLSTLLLFFLFSYLCVLFLLMKSPMDLLFVLTGQCNLLVLIKNALVARGLLTWSDKCTV